MNALRGVDFEKGCYVGQEVVSRMQHRGGSRKRVVRVRLGGAAPAPGTPVLDGELPVGTLGAAAGANALALLRLDRVEEAKAAGRVLRAGGVGVEVEGRKARGFERRGTARRGREKTRMAMPRGFRNTALLGLGVGGVAELRRSGGIENRQNGGVPVHFSFRITSIYCSRCRHDSGGRKNEQNHRLGSAIGALLAFGLSSVANAAFLPAPIETGGGGIVKVAEDCGGNRWRDAYGHCHWFKNRYGTDRGTTHACPTWAHWEAGRCLHS